MESTSCRLCSTRKSIVTILSDIELLKGKFQETQKKLDEVLTMISTQNYSKSIYGINQTTSSNTKEISRWEKSRLSSGILNNNRNDCETDQDSSCHISCSEKNNLDEIKSIHSKDSERDSAPVSSNVSTSTLTGSSYEDMDYNAFEKGLKSNKASSSSAKASSTSCKSSTQCTASQQKNAFVMTKLTDSIESESNSCGHPNMDKMNRFLTATKFKKDSRANVGSLEAEEMKRSNENIENGNDMYENKSCCNIHIHIHDEIKQMETETKKKLAKMYSSSSTSKSRKASPLERKAPSQVLLLYAEPKRVNTRPLLTNPPSCKVSRKECQDFNANSCYKKSWSSCSFGNGCRRYY